MLQQFRLTIVLPVLLTILLPDFSPWARGQSIDSQGSKEKTGSPIDATFFSCPANYFRDIQEQLKIHWPKNRRIHLVFHGHSVPAGYFQTPAVHTFEAYPHLTHVALNKLFSTATIDNSVTAIGGENSVDGAKRFDADVLSIQPDVVFLDYALNDRRIGLEEAEKAWRSMIESTLTKDVKIVLLTPTPDTRENLLDETTPLATHAAMVRRLAAEYKIGLVDSYRAFQVAIQNGQELQSLMSQTNHPNQAGHAIVAHQIALLISTENSESIPKSVDLRPTLKQLGLVQRSQGTRGTCSVFATVEAVEFAVAQCNSSGESLSVEFANWAANASTGRNDDGDFFHNIIRGIEAFGICPEEDMKYSSEFEKSNPNESATQHAISFQDTYQLKFHWLRDWKQKPGLSDNDILAIQKVLADGFPVSAGSYHSVLLVGYETDASFPGGGRFLISDSNLRETEISFEAAKQRFNDLFWVSASNK